MRNIVPAAVRQPIRHRLLSNTITEKPVFARQTRLDLWRLVEDDVHTIEQLLGRRLEGWRKGYSE